MINPRRLNGQDPTQRLQQLGRRLREPRIAALVGVGIAVIVVAVLLLSGGSDSNDGNGSTDSTSAGTTTSGGSGGSAQATKPIEATVDRLLELSSVVGHPVYWAGARPGKKYELTIDNDQNIFIRYLDPGVPIGSKDVSSLTVGTYPVQDAVAALQHEADKPGASTDSAPERRLRSDQLRRPPERLPRLPELELRDRDLRPRPPQGPQPRDIGRHRPDQLTQPRSGLERARPALRPASRSQSFRY